MGLRECQGQDQVIGQIKQTVGRRPNGPFDIGHHRQAQRASTSDDPFGMRGVAIDQQHSSLRQRVVRKSLGGPVR